MTNVLSADRLRSFRPRALQCGRHVLELNRTLIVGVLNVTPDSFSDGGRFVETGKAIEHAERLVNDGADIIDVGGESSRPGSDPVSAEEELARVKPVLEALLERADTPISIDTRKPAVAEECLRLGAHMVNDITGLREPGMLAAVCRYEVPAVIMHMRGEPKTMQENVVYDDVVAEVKRFLEEQARRAEQAGVRQVIVDPGIGFGKTAAHNFEILKRLGELAALPYPLMVGPSRKSFIGHVTGAAAEDRLEGTLAAITAAILGGADLVRVHDVKQCKRAAQVADAIRWA